MPKLLQINVTCNWGSTGKIVEQIGKLAIQNGWESYIAYGRYSNPSASKTIKIGNDMIVYEHYFENRFLDNEGLASRSSTRMLIREIDRINPDIIHLHNIHDHYINYPILFEYLSKNNKTVIWTQHDCWAFTGGCAYYSMNGCNKWKSGCIKCPLREGKIDKRKLQLKLKMEHFQSVDNLILVPVSKWLTGEIKLSYFKKNKILPVYNGIDLDVFKPQVGSEVRHLYGIGDAPYVIGVAAVWDERKNLKDYISLAKYVHNIKIVLVGLSEKQRYNLPSNVIGIPRTQNLSELASLYSEAFAVLNLSLEETFGLTTVEGLACGTPAIVYDCTASPELVSKDTGRVVNHGDISSLVNTVLWMRDNPLSGSDCRKRAELLYDKNKCFEKYITLYKSLL